MPLLRSVSLADSTGASALSGSGDDGRLDDGDHVALAVLEPGGLCSPALGNAVDRLEARRIVLFKDHAPRSKILDLAGDVVNLEAHLGVLPRWRARALKDQEPVAARDLVEQEGRQALRALPDWREPQLVSVEGFCPSQVCRRQRRIHPRVLEHAIPPPRPS